MATTCHHYESVHERETKLCGRRRQATCCSFFFKRFSAFCRSAASTRRRSPSAVRACVHAWARTCESVRVRCTCPHCWQPPASAARFGRPCVRVHVCHCYLVHKHARTHAHMYEGHTCCTHLASALRSLSSTAASFRVAVASCARVCGHVRACACTCVGACLILHLLAVRLLRVGTSLQLSVAMPSIQ